MSIDKGFAWFVSYKRYEDEPISTNIVYARSSANIDHEFADCAWYSMRAARDYEVAEMRAKGIPERDVYACPRCGHALHESDIEGYTFVCYKCDENFYEFEVSL